MNRWNRKPVRGFTLLEMVVVLAVVSILTAVLLPTVARHIRDSRVARAANEELVLAAAVTLFYKDTGRWPAAWGQAQPQPRAFADRLSTGAETDGVVQAVAPGAPSSASWWGGLERLGLASWHLFANNPDGNGVEEEGTDYPVSGEFAWKGPYLDRPRILDPWGNPYVINARFFPGNPDPLVNSLRHQVLVLSAGPDASWSTPFALDRSQAVWGPHLVVDGYTHDDVGTLLVHNR